MIGAIIGLGVQKYLFKDQQKKTTYAEISGTGEVLTSLYVEYALITVKANPEDNPSEEILMQQKN